MMAQILLSWANSICVSKAERILLGSATVPDRLGEVARSQEQARAGQPRIEGGDERGHAGAEAHADEVHLSKILGTKPCHKRAHIADRLPDRADGRT